MTKPEKQIISTDNAPAAIGTYSQAIRVGDTVYISGQIPLDPATMEMVGDDFAVQAARVMHNLQAVAHAAGGSLNDTVKFMVYLTDLGNFAALNDIMNELLEAPYPARAAVEVAALPRGAKIEIDAILCLS